MAKRITSGKREREKLKQTKRQDKQKKKEERLSGGSRSFEDMLAYVDENGVLHTTPQDVNSEKYFFHITNAPAGIAEGDRVTFELERGTRGMNAVRIVISNK